MISTTVRPIKMLVTLSKILLRIVRKVTYVKKSILTKTMLDLWKIISRIIPHKKRPTHVYSKLTDQIANDFNEYFVSVGTLAATPANAAVQIAKDNHIDIPAASDPSMCIGNSLNFSPVSCTHVQRIIKSMPSNKSSDPDNVNMRAINNVL